MILESKNWIVRRQLGIGERQHVRTQLMGIACWDHHRIVEQIVAAIELGDELKMTSRVHLHGEPLWKTRTYHSEIIPLFHMNQNHQLETWDSKLSRKLFDEICTNCDLQVIVKGDGGGPKELSDLMYRTWKESGARFLQGNFALKTADELRALYPQFWHETDSLWDTYQAGISK